MGTDATQTGHSLLSDRAAVHNLVRHVARAATVVAGAYLLARCSANLVFDGGTPLDAARLVSEAALVTVLSGVALFVFSALPIRDDLLRIRNLVSHNESELRDRNRNQRFLRDVQNAFEMAEYESELFDVAGLAIKEAGPGRAEILVADASNAHVERVAIATGRAAPACGVTTPRSCPAVRQGHTLRFGDPQGLAACPRLRERSFDDDAVATCIPINVLGVPAAVLHAVYEPDRSDPDESYVELGDGVRSLEGVAARFGNRLGMMRAMAQSRLQAETDPLTGLINRRAMENRVRELRTDDVSFALALVDLDHFKDLNDTYGHDTGDRALRLFARVARNTVRDGDVVCRHGGEEFVIVLPGADVAGAAPVLHRLRERLAEVLTGAQLPAFTMSAGIVDSSWADELPDLVDRADRALMQAKAAGRDRIVIGDDEPIDRPAGTPSDGAPATIDTIESADRATVRTASLLR